MRRLYYFGGNQQYLKFHSAEDYAASVDVPKKIVAKVLDEHPNGYVDIWRTGRIVPSASITPEALLHFFGDLLDLTCCGDRAGRNWLRKEYGLSVVTAEKLGAFYEARIQGRS